MFGASLSPVMDVDAGRRPRAPMLRAQMKRLEEAARAASVGAHAAAGLCSAAHQVQAARLLRLSESMAREAVAVLAAARPAPDEPVAAPSSRAATAGGGSASPTRSALRRRRRRAAAAKRGMETKEKQAGERAPMGGGGDTMGLNLAPTPSAPAALAVAVEKDEALRGQEEQRLVLSNGSVVMGDLSELGLGDPPLSSSSCRPTAGAPGMMVDCKVEKVELPEFAPGGHFLAGGAAYSMGHAESRLTSQASAMLREADVALGRAKRAQKGQPPAGSGGGGGSAA